MKKLVMLMVAMWGLSACTVIQPGETGVVFNKLTGSMHTEDQGMVLMIPFRSVEAYPTQLRTYTLVRKADEGTSEDDSIDLPTKEGQHIRQDISVTYNTSEDEAANVYKAFRGEDIAFIERTFIRRTLITVAQNISGQMSLAEIISTKRDEFQNKVQQELNTELKKMGFTLDKVNLGAAHLPEAIEKQMQEKMAKQQEAQGAEYELQKQQTLAKAAIARAEGVARANQIMQNSLTPAVLEKMKLDKWNGVLSQVVGTNGGVILNLNK